MTDKKQTIAEQRNYAVKDTEQAKSVASFWLKQAELENVTDFGLPEVDDRYHIWRVPILNKLSKERIGEVVVDARTSLIHEQKTTTFTTLESRLLGRVEEKPKQHNENVYRPSDLRNIIAQGDSERILNELPSESVNLIFTSPPYYNARPEYADYITYESYLLKLRKIIQNAHRVLAEGCFFVINVAPVLLRRANRNEASKRIAVPFDLHKIFIEEGYDFLEDIIWEKPEGAGWATSRGRRFAADRNPMQYKPVPVTEYILVYRKHTTRLIDWHIRSRPEADLEASRITGEYERTNIWRIPPAYDPRHPAIFPLTLAENVVRYYSFTQDVVLDPFAGVGTVAHAAIKLNRRFVMIERNPTYIDVIRDEVEKWMGIEAKNVLTINCAPLQAANSLM